MLEKEEIIELKKEKKKLLNKAIFYKRQRKLLMSRVHQIERILKYGDILA
jgi:hypothetical protein